jgi:transposase
VIRIDAIWMSTEPLDMRAGFDKALARVVQVFGAAHPHHAYLFANARSDLPPSGVPIKRKEVQVEG